MEFYSKFRRSQARLQQLSFLQVQVHLTRFEIPFQPAVYLIVSEQNRSFLRIFGNRVDESLGRPATVSHYNVFVANSCAVIIASFIASTTYPRITVTFLPLGVVAVSVVVRLLISGRPLR